MWTVSWTERSAGVCTESVLSDHCTESPQTSRSLGIAHMGALLQQHKPNSFSSTWRRGGEIQTGVGPTGRRGKQKSYGIGLRDIENEKEFTVTFFRMRNKEESKFQFKKNSRACFKTLLEILFQLLQKPVLENCKSFLMHLLINKSWKDFLVVPYLIPL